jgi:putative membrane protein
MSNRLYRFFQALLLSALFLLLAGKVITNHLNWYINLRFITLAEIGILFLVILAYRLFVEARQHNEGAEHADEHDHVPATLNLWIMLIPLLIGLLIPARPLASSTISSKGLTTAPALISSQSASRPFETESEQRTVLDWVKLFYFESDLSPYIGQRASVVGFVYFDERLPKGQFFVSRVVISCCAADGYAVGMVVEWPNAASIKQDTWVEVKGPVDKVSFDGRISPFIRADVVESVSQPDQPYLYP